MLHREDTDLKVNLYTVTKIKMANGQDRQAIVDLSQKAQPSLVELGPTFSRPRYLENFKYFLVVKKYLTFKCF